MLIIDDQASIRKFLGAYLRDNGFEVFEAWSLSVARRVYNIFKPTIVVLDLVLDEEDGLDFLRSKPDEAATIVISVKSKVDDRLCALELGADDYLTKPIEPRELLLKILKLQQYYRVGKRSVAEEEQLVDTSINVITRTLLGPSGKKAKLSRAEFILFRLLLGQIGAPVEKRQIASVALGHSLDEGSRAVDVMVSKLRRKLQDVGSNVGIQSVRGRGYFAFDAHKSATLG